MAKDVMISLISKIENSFDKILILGSIEPVLNLTGK